eukprot:c13460_g1_i1 orf=3-566(-)
MAAEIPVFSGKDGEDAEIYLRKFVRAGRACQWKDSDLSEFLPDFLEGRAEAWFKSLPSATTGSWDLLKRQFLLKFGVTEDLDALLAQVGRIQQAKDESVEDYVMRYEDLWNRYMAAFKKSPSAATLVLQASSSTNSPVVISGMEHFKLQRFKQSLLPELQLKVVSKNPPTFDQAVIIARAKELSQQRL